jgi:histidine ammonia-lyase
MNLVVEPGRMSLAQLSDFFQDSNPSPVVVADDAWSGIDASRQVVEEIVARRQTVYGVNTGFGKLAQQRISPEDLEKLQVNLVLSHAAGTGPMLPAPVTRLVMLLKINSLARGCSGVRRAVIERLVDAINHDLLPRIPAQGSVGASGDLAPLAHLACALIGVGDVTLEGRVMPAVEAWAELGIEPLQLQSREGLALVNGTQVSTALALQGLFLARRVMAAALVAGAMSVDAALGSDTPLDPRIHRIRIHPGQQDCAEIQRRLLAGSGIRQSHENCDKVQDPYSLRCQPQVMGACLDQLRYVATVLEREANAVSDNPLVFSGQGDVLSGGNFHAEPVALVADALAVAIAETGALSERRIALLIDSNLSGLPPFLVREGGLNSGFMIAQVTAAALASENKSLSHPASVDSLPTSANQEDHVSMATFAARRLEPMCLNTAGIVAIELLAAAQGIDLRAPLRTSPLLQEAHAAIRRRAAFYDADRLFAPDIEAIRELVLAGEFDSPHWLRPEPLFFPESGPVVAAVP